MSFLPPVPPLPHPLDFRGVYSKSGGQGSSGVAPKIKPANLLTQHGTKCAQTDPLSQSLSCHTQGKVLVTEKKKEQRFKYVENCGSISVPVYPYLSVSVSVSARMPPCLSVSVSVPARMPPCMSVCLSVFLFLSDCPLSKLVIVTICISLSVFCRSSYIV